MILISRTTLGRHGRAGGLLALTTIGRHTVDIPITLDDGYLLCDLRFFPNLDLDFEALASLDLKAGSEIELPVVLEFKPSLGLDSTAEPALDLVDIEFGRKQFDA